MEILKRRRKSNFQFLLSFIGILKIVEFIIQLSVIRYYIQFGSNDLDFLVTMNISFSMMCLGLSISSIYFGIMYFAGAFFFILYESAIFMIMSLGNLFLYCAHLCLDVNHNGSCNLTSSLTKYFEFSHILWFAQLLCVVLCIIKYVYSPNIQRNKNKKRLTSLQRLSCVEDQVRELEKFIKNCLHPQQETKSERNGDKNSPFNVIENELNRLTKRKKIPVSPTLCRIPSSLSLAPLEFDSTQSHLFSQTDTLVSHNDDNDDNDSKVIEYKIGNLPTPCLSQHSDITEENRRESKIERLHTSFASEGSVNDYMKELRGDSVQDSYISEVSNYMKSLNKSSQIIENNNASSVSQYSDNKIERLHTSFSSGMSENNNITELGAKKRQSSCISEITDYMKAVNSVDTEYSEEIKSTINDEQNSLCKIQSDDDNEVFQGTFLEQMSNEGLYQYPSTSDIVSANFSSTKPKNNQIKLKNSLNKINEIKRGNVLNKFSISDPYGLHTSYQAGQNQEFIPSLQNEKFEDQTYKDFHKKRTDGLLDKPQKIPKMKYSPNIIQNAILGARRYSLSDDVYLFDQKSKIEKTGDEDISYKKYISEILNSIESIDSDVFEESVGNETSIENCSKIETGVNITNKYKRLVEDYKCSDRDSQSKFLTQSIPFTRTSQERTTSNSDLKDNSSTWPVPFTKTSRKKIIPFAKIDLENEYSTQPSKKKVIPFANCDLRND